MLALLPLKQFVCNQIFVIWLLLSIAIIDSIDCYDYQSYNSNNNNPIMVMMNNDNNNFNNELANIQQTTTMIITYCPLIEFDLNYELNINLTRSKNYYECPSNDQGPLYTQCCEYNQCCMPSIYSQFDQNAYYYAALIGLLGSAMIIFIICFCCPLRRYLQCQNKQDQHLRENKLYEMSQQQQHHHHNHHQQQQSDHVIYNQNGQSFEYQQQQQQQQQKQLNQMNDMNKLLNNYKNYNNNADNNNNNNNNDEWIPVMMNQLIDSPLQHYYTNPNSSIINDNFNDNNNNNNHTKNLINYNHHSSSLPMPSILINPLAENWQQSQPQQQQQQQPHQHFLFDGMV